MGKTQFQKTEMIRPRSIITNIVAQTIDPKKYSFKKIPVSKVDLEKISKFCLVKKKARGTIRSIIHCFTCEQKTQDSSTIEKELRFSSVHWQEILEQFDRQFHEFNKKHALMIHNKEVHRALNEYDEEWFSSWIEEFDSQVISWEEELQNISHYEDSLLRSLWAKESSTSKWTAFEKAVFLSIAKEQRDAYVEGLEKTLNDMQDAFAKLQEQIELKAFPFWEKKLELFENDLNAILVAHNRRLSQKPEWEKTVQSLRLFIQRANVALNLKKKGLSPQLQEEMNGHLERFNEIKASLEKKETRGAYLLSLLASFVKRLSLRKEKAQSSS